MPTALRLVLALAVAASTLALAGGAAARTEGADRGLVTVDYATSFGQFGRDAYIYAAIERGYLRQAGFDVNVTSGTGSVDNIKLVAAGRLDFAPVDIGALVVTKANERVPVRVVSVVHQNTMSAVISLRETGISRPRDLEGKTIADTPASTVRVLFPLYAKKAGIDVDKVTFRDATPPALPALLAAKQVDAVGQFVVGRPLLATAAAGKPLNALRYSDHLPGLLGIGVIASEEALRRNPGQARRFIRALNRGLAYALDNPARAAAMLKKHQPLANEAIAAQELKIMRFFSRSQGTRQHGLGYIDVQKMKSTTSVVRNGFKLANPIAYTSLYATSVVKAATYKPPKKKRP